MSRTSYPIAVSAEDEEETIYTQDNDVFQDDDDISANVSTEG